MERQNALQIEIQGGFSITTLIGGDFPSKRLEAIVGQLSQGRGVMTIGPREPNRSQIDPQRYYLPYRSIIRITAVKVAAPDWIIEGY